jgi:monoamine oxidase
MKKIAIIGAGAAGLAAAQTLLAADPEYHVDLYDLAATYGGRAQSEVWPNGFVFEKGPQYLQDSETNPWTAIAARLQLPVTQAVDPDGVLRLPVDGVWGNYPVHAAPAGLAQDLADAFPYSQVINEQGDQLDPPPNVAVVAPAPGAPASITSQLGAALSNFGPIIESIEPWSYLLSDLQRQDSPPSPNLFVNAGLQTLMERFGEELVTTYPDQLTVRFGYRVQQIVAQNNSVVLHALNLANEQPLEAGYHGCIVTAPVSTIGAITFEPPLDATVTGPLGFLRLGGYKKVALAYAAFPADLAENIIYILPDTVNNVVWQYWRWQQTPGVLIVTVAGSQASALDAMDDAAVMQMAVDALQTAYPDQANWAPTRRAVTNWSHAPGILGAYSYTAPATGAGTNDQTDTAFQARPNLRDAVYQTRVWFTGEATNTDQYGTLGGAYDEGHHTAGLVIAALPVA